MEIFKGLFVNLMEDEGDGCHTYSDKLCDEVPVLNETKKEAHDMIVSEEAVEIYDVFKGISEKKELGWIAYLRTIVKEFESACKLFDEIPKRVESKYQGPVVGDKILKRISVPIYVHEGIVTGQVDKGLEYTIYGRVLSSNMLDHQVNYGKPVEFLSLMKELGVQNVTSGKTRCDSVRN